jgi:hypothetical protein
MFVYTVYMKVCMYICMYVCMYVVDTFLTKGNFCRLVAYLSDASEHVELPPPTIWKPIILSYMYVCMYVVWTYMCITVRTVSLHVCIYVCMCVCMHVYVCR